jgi:hypothetical protein
MAYFPTIKISDIYTLLKQMLLAMINPPCIDKTANSIRTQPTSGTITTVTTVGTVTTITTIGVYTGEMLVRHTNINAWANTCRALIT